MDTKITINQLLRADRGLTLLRGDPATRLSSVAYDSRQVKPGGIFFALPGQRYDGHGFLSAAAAAGAAAVCVERDVSPPAGVAVILAADARRSMATAAAELHGHPSRRMHVTGVTGTKGKTTTTHLIRAIAARHGHQTGLIGTIHNIVGGRSEAVKHTTPEAPDLQEIFARMVAAGDRRVVMEVSSHALALHRVDGTRFAVGALTNIGHDHLDFHGTVDRYVAAKAMLFERIEEAAVVNGDDPASETMRAAGKPGLRVWSYGLSPGCDVRAESIELGAQGATYVAVTPVGAAKVRLRLPGRFNVYNSLTALACSLAAGDELDPSVEALGEISGVPGRFERVIAGQPFTVIVDYAHTPESLEGVLTTAREVTKGRLIVVFGCGGDRDRTRRPITGRLAAELADVVFVTSDNPRSEDPERIIDEIVAGMPEGAQANPRRLADRATAIREALAAAEPGDVVVIAGKGHEIYQIIGDQAFDFDDREVAREVLRQLGYGGDAK